MSDWFSTKAPEIPIESVWLNTDKLISLKNNLGGHIVVLNFWTYCCINCLHLLPELKYLEEKFAKEPIIFISIHSGKFTNETNIESVKSAIVRYEIQHPVIFDKDYKLWLRYAINSWPTIVIIDAKGDIVYKQSGEGQRFVITNLIQSLLEDAKSKKLLVQEKIKINSILKKPTTLLSFPGKIDLYKNELVISDSNHNRILVTELNENKAKIKYSIGSGLAGFKDGSFAVTQFNHPQGVVRYKDTIFVADTENHAIRRINLKTKKVETIAGNGMKNFTITGKGNGLTTSLNSPWDLEVLDDFLYIAMAGIHQIWRLNIKTNEIDIFAGSSKENIVDGPLKTTQLAQPSGLAKSNDCLFFVDSATSALRKINPIDKIVETLIGSGLFDFGDNDGSFIEAKLQHPLGLTYFNGNLFVADTFNHAIKKVDLVKKNIITIIGSQNQKNCLLCFDKNLSTRYLPLNEPNDIIATENKLIIADTNNHLIRIFDFKSNSLNDLEIRSI